MTAPRKNDQTSSRCTSSPDPSRTSGSRRSSMLASDFIPTSLRFHQLYVWQSLHRNLAQSTRSCDMVSVSPDARVGRTGPTRACPECIIVCAGSTMNRVPNWSPGRNTRQNPSRLSVGFRTWPRRKDAEGTCQKLCKAVRIRNSWATPGLCNPAIAGWAASTGTDQPRP